MHFLEHIVAQRVRIRTAAFGNSVEARHRGRGLLPRLQSTGVTMFLSISTTSIFVINPNRFDDNVIERA
jgi:plasmid stability protein